MVISNIVMILFLFFTFINYIYQLKSSVNILSEFGLVIITLTTWTLILQCKQVLFTKFFKFQMLISRITTNHMDSNFSFLIFCLIIFSNFKVYFKNVGTF